MTAQSVFALGPCYVEVLDIGNNELYSNPAMTANSVVQFTDPNAANDYGDDATVTLSVDSAGLLLLTSDAPLSRSQAQGYTVNVWDTNSVAGVSAWMEQLLAGPALGDETAQAVQAAYAYSPIYTSVDENDHLNPVGATQLVTRTDGSCVPDPTPTTALSGAAAYGMIAAGNGLY